MESNKQTIIQRGSARFMMAIEKPEQLEEWMRNHADAIGLAMVGRSNVGKSSIINSMFGAKTAKTSKTPGRTQKINIFKFFLNDDDSRFFYLFDLPGYGHAKVSKSMLKNWNELIATFFKNINRNIVLFNIQDARHPNQDADKSFYEFVNPKYFEIYLIFNKIDKLKKQKEKAALEKIKPLIYKEFKAVKQIFFVSAEKKMMIPQLEQSLISYIMKRYDTLQHQQDENEEE